MFLVVCVNLIWIKVIFWRIRKYEVFSFHCGGVCDFELNSQGETFDVPEVVLFRLTHNMTNAMGALGPEGPFRRSCEITIEILREKSSVFMSVLRPFVFDPLVEWSSQIHIPGLTSGLKEASKITKPQTSTQILQIRKLPLLSRHVGVEWWLTNEVMFYA